MNAGSAAGGSDGVGETEEGGEFGFELFDFFAVGVEEGALVEGVLEFAEFFGAVAVGARERGGFGGGAAGDGGEIIFVRRHGRGQDKPARQMGVEGEGSFWNGLASDAGNGKVGGGK